MKNNACHITLLCIATWLMASCATRKKITTDFYFQHEKELVEIEQTYRNLNDPHPFSIEFTDNSFDYINLEIQTGPLKRIYEFGINEPRLPDTLSRYGLPVTKMLELVNRMRSNHCIWIHNLDYYTNNQKNYLVFMSFRQVRFRLPFAADKYFILTFYEQPQYFDPEGNLLDNRRLRRIRKINGEIFRRINNKVCYTISSRFR